MINFIKRNWQLLSIFLISFIIFSPSLFTFFTNDDFFFLKIANVSSPKEFLNFFNLVTDTGAIGVYRPLTLRVFYFLGIKIFNLNPFPLHVISFITFFAVTILVGKLVRLLFNDKKIALVSMFLYAVSVTHFGQLYYIGAFQELFLTLVFLESVIFFVEYEIDSKHPPVKLIASFSFFVLGLMSKETAVVLPFVLILTHFYLKLSKRLKFSFRSLIYSVAPYFVVLGVYLFLHFRYFGTISGDSYVWDFSITRAINTLVWYSLWSFNLPETLVDFVGPGLHFNPNLFKYWSAQIVPIFIFFTFQSVFVVYTLIRTRFSRYTIYNILYALIWFALTIAPVVFLPVHKFTYYLTLPLVGVVMLLTYLFTNLKSKIYILFCIVWLITSIMSLRLTLETNWITQGQNISKRVFLYFKNTNIDPAIKNISFVDTPNDAELPWSPTSTLKNVISDKSLFDIYYPELSSKIKYTGLSKDDVTKDVLIIQSRQFLGY